MINTLGQKFICFTNVVLIETCLNCNLQIIHQPTLSTKIKKNEWILLTKGFHIIHTKHFVRENEKRISAWCHMIDSNTVVNSIKHKVRRLILAIHLMRWCFVTGYTVRDFGFHWLLLHDTYHKQLTSLIIVFNKNADRLAQYF